MGGSEGGVGDKEGVRGKEREAVLEFRDVGRSEGAMRRCADAMGRCGCDGEE